MQALQVPWFVHAARQLLGVVRAGRRRSDALILLTALAITFACFTPISATALFGRELLSGLHVETLGFMAWLAGVAIVLARRRARNRALEQTTAELRHQVTERSRDLADALAMVARQPPQPVARTA